MWFQCHVPLTTLITRSTFYSTYIYLRVCVRKGCVFGMWKNKRASEFQFYKRKSDDIKWSLTLGGVWHVTSQLCMGTDDTLPPPHFQPCHISFCCAFTRTSIPFTSLYSLSFSLSHWMHTCTHTAPPRDRLQVPGPPWGPCRALVRPGAIQAAPNTQPWAHCVSLTALVILYM